MGFNTRNAKRNLIPSYCEVCGWTKFVTKHRIKPGRRGGKYIQGNVIGLCPNCHILAEKGELSQYFLFDIVHNRLQLQFKLGS